MVFVPGQDLTPDAHRALGARFGEIEIHPFLKKLDADHPEIVVLESDADRLISEASHSRVLPSDRDSSPANRQRGQDVCGGKK